MLAVVAPIVVVSEANAREFWPTKHRRTAEQRRSTRVALIALTPRQDVRLPCVVELVRIAPCELDDGDNLNIAFKAVRDEITAWLGLPNDRDPRVKFQYGQRSDQPRTYGIEIRFSQKPVDSEDVRR